MILSEGTPGDAKEPILYKFLLESFFAREVIRGAFASPSVPIFPCLKQRKN